MNDLKDVRINELHDVLQPETLFERFAARKATQVAHSKDFIQIKGQKMQQELKSRFNLKQENDIIGFKCLHYSVTESSGHVDITILNKNVNMEYTFGVRTVEGTAHKGTEFREFDEIVTIKQREQEKTVSIKIIDNNEWQPDLDFYVELYDP